MTLVKIQFEDTIVQIDTRKAEAWDFVKRLVDNVIDSVHDEQMLAPFIAERDENSAYKR